MTDRPILMSGSMVVATMREIDPYDALRCVLDPQLGGIIGTAEIVDCVEAIASDSPWFVGPFGLVLCNVQPVPFIPVKGALGLFNWKNNLEKIS